MHLPRNRVVAIVVAIAVSLAGCRDGTAPKTPVTATALEKIAGDGQSAVRGNALESPLRLRVTGSNGKPFGGTGVQWAVVAGEATLAASSSSTNGSGETEAQVTTVGSVGNILVSAVTAGVMPAIFSLEGLDPCYFQYATHLTVGATRAGTLTTLACLAHGDRLHDLYLFTLTSQQAVLASVRSTAFDPGLELYPFQGWYWLVGDTVNATRDARLKAILPAQTYGLVATTVERNVTGTYDIGVSATSESAESCEFVLTFVGITTTQSLATTDCAGAGGEYSDRFRLVLLEGQRVTITQSAAAYVPSLKLLRRDEVVAAASAGGTTTLDYTVEVSSVYHVQASSSGAGQTGSYTLQIAHAAGSATASSATRAERAGQAIGDIRDGGFAGAGGTIHHGPSPGRTRTPR